MRRGCVFAPRFSPQAASARLGHHPRLARASSTRSRIGAAPSRSVDHLYRRRGAIRSSGRANARRPSNCPCSFWGRTGRGVASRVNCIKAQCICQDATLFLLFQISLCCQSLAGEWGTLALVELRPAAVCKKLTKKLTKRPQTAQKKGQLLRLAFYKYLILLRNLVEPGGIEPPSASPPQSVLHA